MGISESANLVSECHVKEKSRAICGAAEFKRLSAEFEVIREKFTYCEDLTARQELLQRVSQIIQKSSEIICNHRKGWTHTVRDS